MKTLKLEKFGSFRLLTEYHSFLLEDEDILTEADIQVSVSLRSIIHSYPIMWVDNNKSEVGFPSPYGVSFILMKIISLEFVNHVKLGFPSPYGVSFILIEVTLNEKTVELVKFPSPYGVSFILIQNPFFDETKCCNGGFRLLMEYHSFLSSN